MKPLAFLVSGFLMLSAMQFADASGESAPPSPDELNQLVAPIALYPDALVAQIVAASSYPTEVVEADRWLQQHSELRGQAFAQEVDSQSWDPSVKALTQFPSVLATMDTNLSWTSSLGEAYVSEPQTVLDAVQVLRRRAQQAGNLNSTPQEAVTSDGPTIAIEPANPEVVYVPEYDPWTVYGSPLGFYPDWVGVPGAFYYGPGIDFGLGIGIGLFAGVGWGWHHWDADWRRRDVRYDHHPYLSHSPTFDRNRPFDHHDFAGGHAFGRPGIDRPDFGQPGRSHPDVGHPNFGRPDFGHARIDHAGAIQHAMPVGPPLGIRSGAFSGFNHGGIANAYSSRGQASVQGNGGGFRAGGGFQGTGGFHGGGGHR